MLRKQAQSSSAADLTFQPVINSASRKLLSSTSSGGGGGGGGGRGKRAYNDVPEMDVRLTLAKIKGNMRSAWGDADGFNVAAVFAHYDRDRDNRLSFSEWCVYN